MQELRDSNPACTLVLFHGHEAKLLDNVASCAAILYSAHLLYSLRSQPETIAAEPICLGNGVKLCIPAVPKRAGPLLLANLNKRALLVHFKESISGMRNPQGCS